MLAEDGKGETCAEQIIQSEDNENQLPLALRLSGLLLLGLVKIYSRQLQYLQEDCLTAVQELDKVSLEHVIWELAHRLQHGMLTTCFMACSG